MLRTIHRAFSHTAVFSIRHTRLQLEPFLTRLTHPRKRGGLLVVRTGDTGRAVRSATADDDKAAVHYALRAEVSEVA